MSFCQFNYFILIDTTIVSSLLLTTIIHNCADTNFFSFLLFSLPLEFSFSSKFFQGCLHFPLETFIQTVEKFRSGLITSRNFRARFFTLENFIFLEEGTNYGSCTTLKYFTPSFQGGFFDDFAHDSKEHVGGDVYIYIYSLNENVLRQIAVFIPREFIMAIHLTKNSERFSTPPLISHPPFPQRCCIFTESESLQGILLLQFPRNRSA